MSNKIKSILFFSFIGVLVLSLVVSYTLPASVNASKMTSKSLEKIDRHILEAKIALDNEYLAGVKLHLKLAIEELNNIQDNKTNITTS